MVPTEIYICMYMLYCNNSYPQSFLFSCVATAKTEKKTKGHEDEPAI